MCVKACHGPGCVPSGSIPMNFQKIPPSAPLQHVVDCYWVLYDDEADPAAPRQQAVLPSPLQSVSVVCRQSCSLTAHDGVQLHQLAEGALLLFPGNRRVSLCYQAPVRIFGVAFRPCGFYQLFGAALLATTDETRRPDGSPWRFGQELKRCVLAATDARQCVAGAEDLLLAGLESRAPQLPVIGAIVAHVLERHGQVSVDEMAHHANLSRRQLERRFGEAVGVPPKMFAEISRFAHVVGLLHEQREANWQDLTHACGFFDQAHFIREFRRFAGEAPGSYFHREPMAHLLF